MNAINLWLFYFLLDLITITTIVQSREYHVKDKQIVSYMYKRFYDIKEKIFPADIRINVSVSRSVGTLLYSIDKNMNQLIVSLHNGQPYAIKVEFNRQEIIRSLPELCGCERCRYEILDLRIQLNTHINIRCNGGNTYRVRIMKKKEINENYPILFNGMHTSNVSTNEAHLWLVNTPQYEKVYPNNQQMYGCIFKVSYMDKPIYFTNKTSDITDSCIKKCRPNICNGGQCLEAYNDYPVCNCTTSFLNGRYCNDDIRPKNLRSSNQLFIFDMIKLSWNSSVNTIFNINNSIVSISLDIVKENVFLELKYSKKYNIKVTFSLNYVHDNPSICIAYFQEKFINIWLFNNGSWSNGQIFSEYELKREIFDSLTLQSGNGNISLFTKSNEEYAWRRVHIIQSIEIKNYNISGNDRNLQVSVNNSGLSASFMITVTVVILILIIMVLIIVIVRRRRSKKNIKYAKLRGNDDYKEDKKKDIEKTKDLSDSPLFHLFKKEHKEYIKVCKGEIGYDIVKKGDSDIKKWNKFILQKIQIDAISSHRLERMYEVMKNIKQDETYLSDIIVLLIHTRIFAVPSMSAVPKDHRSIQYLAALISDKYNHEDELQRLSEQVIECMMDFLEDISAYNDPEKIYHKLFYEMLAFVGYNIVIDKDNYKYHNKRTVTFLEKYSLEDNLERLWSAVIMYANTRDPKHITTLKNYLNTNVILGENLSKDMIILSLATPRLHPSHNLNKSVLANINYQIIISIAKYKILSKENIQIFTVNIINIFNHQYKEGIIKSMEANSDLFEHKMAIKCLKACLKNGLINADKLFLMTSLLKEFFPYVARNNKADQIVQSVLNHLLEHKKYQKERIKDKLYHLCIEYFHTDRISEETKHLLSLIICFTAANMTNITGIDDVINYLADIIARLNTRGTESYFNLPITEIEYVLLQVTPIQNKSKDE